VHSWHAEVEHNRVRHLGDRQDKGLSAAAGCKDFEIRFQRQLVEIPLFDAIINNQDQRARSAWICPPHGFPSTTCFWTHQLSQTASCRRMLRFEGARTGKSNKHSTESTDHSIRRKLRSTRVHVMALDPRDCTAFP